MHHVSGVVVGIISIILSTISSSAISLSAIRSSSIPFTMDPIVIIPSISFIPIQCMEITMHAVSLTVLPEALLPIHRIIIITKFTIVGVSPAVKDSLLMLPQAFGVFLCLCSVWISIPTTPVALILALLRSGPFLLERSINFGVL